MNLKKKMIYAFLLIFLFVGIGSTFAIVRAEEVPVEEETTEVTEEIIPSTDKDEEATGIIDQLDEFSKTWLSPILSFLSSVIGALSVLVIAFNRLKVSTNSMNQSATNVNVAKEELTATYKEISTKLALEQTNCLEQYKLTMEELNAQKEALNESMVKLNETQETLAKLVNENAQMNEALRIAVCTNETMVSSGKATQVNEVLKNE